MRHTAGDLPQVATAEDSSRRRTIKTADVHLSVEELKAYLNDWNVETQLRQHTPQSVHSRHDRMGKFLWFLDHKSITQVGIAELRAFFLYCATGHSEPEGRWGNHNLTTPLRAVSVQGYYRIVKAFYNFLVAEEILDSNPVKRIKPPAVRAEAKQPVVDENVQKILKACKHSLYPRRDLAIVLMLLDSEMRASKLCGLEMSDWDAQSRSIRVLGKGQKYRTVYLGLATTRALTSYLRGQSRRAECPLFVSKKGKAITASGLFQMMKRLSSEAGVANPGIHALRRSFAVSMLKSGANAFTVQMLLGHSSLEMTRRYCRIAEADCREQHQKYSPADRLNNR